MESPVAVTGVAPVRWRAALGGVPRRKAGGTERAGRYFWRFFFSPGVRGAGIPLPRASLN
jgi:hypothetical protein